MTMKLERAKQLYKQCEETYKRCINRYDTAYVMGSVEMRGPNDFDDEFNVPATLLFQELCHGNKNMDGHYDVFRWNLLLSIHAKEEFNEKKLTRNSPLKQLKEYRVYFEVFVQKENSKVSLPFKQYVVVNGIKFKWCSQRTVAAAFNDYQSRPEGSIGVPSLTIDQQRSLVFPELTDSGKRCIYPVVAVVSSDNAYNALNMALSNFEIVKNAVNITQAIGLRSVCLSGRRPASLTMVTTGLYIARSISDPSDSILRRSSVKIHELPKQKLNFTGDRKRVDLYHKIIKAACDSATVSSRVRSVVEELSLAYSSDNPGLRQLSCWRCLEIATAKSNENRKEKDVIRIFQNYHSNTFWKQMGDLVLKLRNTYVHQGKLIDFGGSTSDYYLNWSQQYAEKSLMVLLYLYDNRSTWNTEQHIDKFFDYYAEPDSSLKVAQQLLSARKKHK